jgi:hypothetical protein
VEGSPVTTKIGPPELLQDPSKRLAVSGRVLSLLVSGGVDAATAASSCSVGVPNVTVEVWYAGNPDTRGNYYQPDAFRGRIATDECGRYSFVQAFPALYPTRPILHDHFRLSLGGERELLVTQLYFLRSNDGGGGGGNSSSQPTLGGVSSDGYVTDRGAYPLRAVPVTRDSDGSRSVTFDVYLDNVQTQIVSEQGPGTTLFLASCPDSMDKNPAPTPTSMPSAPDDRGGGATASGGRVVAASASLLLSTLLLTAAIVAQ